MVCKCNRRTWPTWEAPWSYFSRLFVLILSVLFTTTIASGQASQKKNVLIITEVGLSHSAISSAIQQIAGGVQDTPDRHVEFYTESLDLVSFPSRPSRKETRDWLDKKYGQYKLDVVVAVGPDVIDFLSHYTQSLFLEVPIVICGTSAEQLGNPRLDSRFTGTWMKLEPEKTLEVALRLFPYTRHVFVVGGSSAFDKVVISLTKTALRSFNTKAEILYLTEMEMGTLLKQLQDLPDHSIVLYTSFFQDSAGNKFINATKALPAIAAASHGPDFGMSDTYLAHGIVGGYVMPFEKQGKITAQIISQLLDGKKVQELPIETIPSVYMFDWHQLQSWHISESSLPPGSVVVFREPSLWERYKWTWAAVLAIILGLSALAGYLQYSRKQLKLARERQTQLSGMLISAEEQERSRLAAELHDDFSQRLALLALGLENAADAIPVSPNEASRQLHELVNSTSEIGADLHTLSHRLHSSTLESLGLVPAVASLCKEFSTQQEVKVNFISADIPYSVDPNAALCIFRIVQEGLRNLKKHSGVREALVNLRRTDNRLEVSVRDRGCGFDLSGLRQSGGIGIRSMEERARQLGGEFEIHSVPGKGTRVEAWVPLRAATGHAAS
jgi:signal transduction histidine kinase